RRPERGPRITSAAGRDVDHRQGGPGRPPRRRRGGRRARRRRHHGGVGQPERARRGDEPGLAPPGGGGGGGGSGGGRGFPAHQGVGTNAEAPQRTYGGSAHG